MKHHAGFTYLLLSLTLFFLGCSESPSENTVNKGIPVYEKTKLVYPNSYPDSAVHEKFNAVTVSDNYRWLEHFSSNSGRWVSQQQSTTNNYFDGNPFRRGMEDRIKKYWDYERYTLPVRRGGKYFYQQNNGLQQQDVLLALDDPFGQPYPVLDPNKFNRGEILQNAKVSKDGKKVAYQVSSDGSSWRTVRIRDLTSGMDLEEKLIGVKHSCISWAGDGFFYSRYDKSALKNPLSEKDKFHQVFYHKLGTLQDEDEMIFADRHNPFSILDVMTTSDEKFLAIKIFKNTLGNAFWFKNLEEENSELTLLNDRYDYEFYLIDNIGDNLLIKTNYQAPKGRLILVNSKNPEEKYWQEIVAEDTEVLQTAELVNDKIVACYLYQTYSVVKVFDLEGNFTGILDLPEKGKVKCFEGERDQNLAFFGFSTLTKPMSLYSVNMNEMSIKPFRSPKVAFEVEKYESKLEWFKSYDGEKIPIYIVHRKGKSLDGESPALLVVDGGLGDKTVPEFNPTGLNLFHYILEKDGVCALVCVRGGKELGMQWQLKGIKNFKQNSIDDFQAAAEYLIKERYTSAKHLAVFGRKNGGMIVGASLTQRPDLFGVVIAEDGIFDMLRYQEYSIGWQWSEEFGKQSDHTSFEHLFAYSPVHNIEPDDFPPTILVAGKQNDIVLPFHTYKFLAGLQQRQQSEHPVILSLDDNGDTKNITYLDHQINRAADILAFLEFNLEGKLPR